MKKSLIVKIIALSACVASLGYLYFSKPKSSTEILSKEISPIDDSDYKDTEPNEESTASNDKTDSSNEDSADVSKESSTNNQSANTKKVSKSVKDSSTNKNAAKNLDSKKSSGDDNNTQALPELPVPTPPHSSNAKIGFVKSLNTGDELTVGFDEVEFYTNHAATEEYNKDHSSNPVDYVFNDYYIRNSSTATKQYKLSPNAKITIDGSANISTQEFYNYVVNKLQGIDSDSYRSVLFWIETNGDTITSISFQFTP